MLELQVDASAVVPMPCGWDCFPLACHVAGIAFHWHAMWLGLLSAGIHCVNMKYATCVGLKGAAQRWHPSTPCVVCVAPQGKYLFRVSGCVVCLVRVTLPCVLGSPRVGISVVGDGVLYASLCTVGVGLSG